MLCVHRMLTTMDGVYIDGKVGVLNKKIECANKQQYIRRSSSLPVSIAKEKDMNTTTTFQCHCVVAFVCDSAPDV